MWTNKINTKFTYHIIILSKLCILIQIDQYMDFDGLKLVPKLLSLSIYIWILDLKTIKRKKKMDSICIYIILKQNFYAIGYNLNIYKLKGI